MSQDGHVIQGERGTIRVEADAVTGLVVTAVELVAGARVRRPRRGLHVHVEGGRARVELELAARYGSVLPELAVAVQRSVTDALERCAGLAVTSVDVSVEELEG